MNQRQRNKYEFAKCSHRYICKDLLTTDPIPYYQEEDRCRIGCYDSCNDEYCKHTECKHFAISREEMRIAREKRKGYLKLMKECQKFSDDDSEIDFDYDLIF